MIASGSPAPPRPGGRACGPAGASFGLPSSVARPGATALPPRDRLATRRWPSRRTSADLNAQVVLRRAGATDSRGTHPATSIPNRPAPTPLRLWLRSTAGRTSASTNRSLPPARITSRTPTPRQSRPPPGAILIRPRHPPPFDKAPCRELPVPATIRASPHRPPDRVRALYECLRPLAAGQAPILG